MKIIDLSDVPYEIMQAASLVDSYMRRQNPDMSGDWSLGQVCSRSFEFKAQRLAQQLLNAVDFLDHKYRYSPNIYETLEDVGYNINTNSFYDEN